LEGHPEVHKIHHSTQLSRITVSQFKETCSITGCHRKYKKYKIKQKDTPQKYLSTYKARAARVCRVVSKGAL
jgi:hypothetical protein